MPLSNVWVTLVDLIPLIGGMIVYRHLGQGLKILFFFTAMAIPFDILNLTLRMYGINNLWVLHVFTLVEYTVIAWMLALWSEGTFRAFIRISIAAFAVLWIVSKIVFESFDTYDSFMSTTESLLIIVMCTYVLIQIGSKVDDLTADSRFWVVVGLLTYFAGNFTVFALRNLLYFWSLHNIILTITNLLLLKAFVCSRNPRNSGLY